MSSQLSGFEFNSMKPGCPQDVKLQDRDETETVNLQDRDETETFNLQDQDETETLNPQDRDETETFNLQDRDETFQKNVSRPRRSRPRLHPWYEARLILLCQETIDSH